MVIRWTGRHSGSNEGDLEFMQEVAGVVVVNAASLSTVKGTWELERNGTKGVVRIIRVKGT